MMNDAFETCIEIKYVAKNRVLVITLIVSCLIVELSSGRGRFIDMSNSTKRASRRGEKWKDDRSKEKSFNTTKKLNFTSQRV